MFFCFMFRMDKTAGFLDTLKRLFTQTERVFALTNARYGQWNGEKSQGLEMCCIFRKLCSRCYKSSEM